ncbi:hypothetical protein FZEAL_7528 [Fusarium zealandicum]|uniref:Ubiquitin-like protease family profile domain-containing protein n=1 Tax=Fusarium zealandicum TaxID=1053134 RepID=A0A8H4XIS2_9HYPO|nr:hypothetical protein FZEAL_7528 [Fusarium zealandicum]
MGSDEAGHSSTQGPGSSSSVDTSSSTFTANSEHEISPATAPSSAEPSPRSSTSSADTKEKKMPFRQRMARHFGDSLAPEKPYLSYYDVLLTAEDIKALKHDWLTDNNIAFWEEYLERETLPKYPQARIVLLRPSMTFLLMKEPDMRSVSSALPDFSKTTHVFMPINDNRNVSVAEGGSHWSLLLVSTLDGVAFHYDSMGGANYAEANLATRKMASILQRPLRFINLEDCPQQENGSDCGVFVCLLMRHLLVKRLLCANAREKVSMSMGGKMVDSYGGRKEMLRIIENLRKEGEQFEERLQRLMPLEAVRTCEDQAAIGNENSKARVVDQDCKKATPLSQSAEPKKSALPPWAGMRSRLQHKEETVQTNSSHCTPGPRTSDTDRVSKRVLRPRNSKSPLTPVKIRGKRRSRGGLLMATQGFGSVSTR